jgi:hypothetical protein
MLIPQPIAQMPHVKRTQSRTRPFRTVRSTRHVSCSHHTLTLLEANRSPSDATSERRFGRRLHGTSLDAMGFR